MNFFKYIIANILETLLRILPVPSKTGLVKIGNPHRNSPVLLTGNYHLTVERVKRCLRGIDAYLLVANSRGVNVWCAATGGHLTNHDVISVLKTSGINVHVSHRRIILPQLVATGIEGKVVREKTGWKAIWGPVHAEDIPAFLNNHFEKTAAMRRVKFSLTERLEMAVAWAFPTSVIFSLLVLPFWPETILTMVFLIWGLSLMIFMSFPLYGRWLKSERKGVGFSATDLGRGGLALILWGISLLGLAIFAILIDFTLQMLLYWGTSLTAIISILTLDLLGSTPVYKSGTHEDRLLEVALDENKCEGAGFCERVCPKNCFEVNKTSHIATMPRAHECVQCGACIVQCPFDALYFQSANGKVIPPESTRRFKLNMMGKRLVTT